MAGPENSRGSIPPIARQDYAICPEHGGLPTTVTNNPSYLLEQFNLGLIDRWWVELQELSFINKDASITMSMQNLMRIAAQQSNLVEDHSKIPKPLDQWCPPTFNPIVLYKLPYSYDQDKVKSYLGRATICPTMEAKWQGSNPTPPPPLQDQSCHRQHKQDQDVNTNMMTLDGLVSNLNLMTQIMPTMLVQKLIILMTIPQHIQPSIQQVQAQVANTIPMPTAPVVATALASDQMSQMQQLQCPQQQY